MGPYRGGQAEYPRVPWADFNLLDALVQVVRAGDRVSHEPFRAGPVRPEDQ
jgi:hypothetical protein